MIKIRSCIGMLLLMLAFSIPIGAAAEQLPQVIDMAEILSDSEYPEINERLSLLRDTYGADAVFIITDEIASGDAQAEADNVYDYCGYGVGESKDGILYLVCPSSREYAFSTCGKGIEIFNDDGLEYIDSAMLPYLKEGDYYGAALVYADKCEELMETAANGKPYTKPINILYVIGGIILIPLAAAFILMMYKLSKMNTAVKQSGAADYMKPGSMNLDNSRDIFLYSTVTKREKPKSNSTTHTSSSGTNHGGRSGSF